MLCKARTLSSGFPLFIGWATAVLGVFLCLIAAEFAVLGSFSWNYEPEIDLLLKQNATDIEVQKAQIRAKDVAHMRIISEVVLAIVLATFFMALVVWRLNVKDMLEKEKIEAEWASSRTEIKTISQNFGFITELLVYGLVHLTPLESKKASEFLQKFRMNDPQCGIILHQILANKDQPKFSQMSPEDRATVACQHIRGILNEYDNVSEGSSLYSEAYYSVAEGSL